MIPPEIHLKGDQALGQQWIGYAKSQLRILQDQMELTRPEPLNEGVRYISPIPGVNVTCISSYGKSELVIDVLQYGKKDEQFEKEQKSEFEFIKIFVHVDVINTESWHIEWLDDTSYEIWIDGDLLTRSMISSAVSCGLVGISDSLLHWESVKIPTRTPTMEGGDVSVEWLAHNNVNHPWDGIYARSEYYTTENLLKYYNDLFSDAPNYTSNLLYVPSSAWLTSSLRSGTSSSISYGSCLEGTGNLTELGCYYSYYVSGWCDNNERFANQITGDYYYFSSGPPYYFTYSGYLESLQQDYRLFDTYKLTLPTDYGDFTLSDCIQKIEGIVYRKSLIAGATYDDYTLGIWYNSNDSYPLHIHSPVAGICWSFPIDTWISEEWDGDDYIQTFYVTRELLENASDYINPAYPYNGKVMLPFEDLVNMADSSLFAKHTLLCRPGTTLDSNYMLPDGFVWYSGMFGGNIAKLVRTTNTTKVCEYSEIRGLVNLTAVAGYNIEPWIDRTSDPLHATLKYLAEKAIVKAGGVVYSNSSIPVDLYDDEKIGIKDHLGFDIPQGASSFKNVASGLLYCSPLFNIRVYAIPVK